MALDSRIPAGMTAGLSFRHGLLEPSHREVNLRVGALPKSYIHPSASYRPWH